MKDVPIFVHKTTKCLIFRALDGGVNITTYIIERSSGRDNVTFPVNERGSAETHSYTFDDLEAGEFESYRLYTVNIVGQSRASTWYVCVCVYVYVL